MPPRDARRCRANALALVLGHPHAGRRNCGVSGASATTVPWLTPALNGAPWKMPLAEEMPGYRLRSVGRSPLGN